ncbi:unnamed protein product [Bursaphelenchus okinawaensis]|uniref:Uncharacterized protein n=1 Tax=Bursaphelenchus okinawaensis TaxID=465554 RepID=A0A811LKB0_9BILA|nr:unnamed protein product [Bursaphelenchus okinawaensis]CAG9127445.1 unnamed protein product [Bursaphelenchus okinawaensis]
MEFLDDAQNLLNITEKSVKSYVSESLKVMVAQSRRNDFVRPRSDNSYSSTSGYSPQFKRFHGRYENDMKAISPRLDVFRPPKSPRDKASSIAQSPRYQLKFQIEDCL